MAECMCQLVQYANIPFNTWSVVKKILLAYGKQNLGLSDYATNKRAHSEMVGVPVSTTGQECVYVDSN